MAVGTGVLQLKYFIFNVCFFKTARCPHIYVSLSHPHSVVLLQIVFKYFMELFGFARLLSQNIFFFKLMLSS